jgi:MFS family permease
VWVTIAAYTGVLFCVYAQWNTLAPVVARDGYGDTGLFGVLEALSGAGAVVAALVGVRWRPRRPLLMGLLLGLLWPVQSIVLAVLAPLVVVVPIVLAAGFGIGLMVVWWETALAHHVPPHALSRVSSYDWMGSLALLPAGFAVAGPLAGLLGARTVLAAGGVLGLLLTFAAMLPRSTRELGPAPQPSRSVTTSV